MIACMLKLVVISIFSVGLAAHTLRFDIHYKFLIQEVLTLILMLLVIGIGLAVNIYIQGDVIEANI